VVTIRHPRLNGVARREALFLVEELLVRRFERGDILKAVRQRFGDHLSDNAIDMYIDTVTKAWKAESERMRPHRQERQRRSLARLSRAAEKDRDWPSVMAAERLLAKIDGTEQPLRVVSAVAGEGGVSPFEGRSIEDLNFAAEHGYFPEEAPELNVAKRSKTNGHSE
jgi:hypothetical protein